MCRKFCLQIYFLHVLLAIFLQLCMGKFTPVVLNMQIQEVHPVPHSNFLPFLSIFSYLSYLGHPSLLGLQTKTRRQSSSSTFYSFKFYNSKTFMSSTASAHKKCLAQKVARFGSLGWIPIIQTPFNSSCAALQYETGMKFFHRAVPEIHDIENHKSLV